MQTQPQSKMNENIRNIKIGTWNLCLGLKNKKDYVSKIINQHNVDIMSLQETDIEQNYPINILSFKGYDYLNENNTSKARTGMYIKASLPYLRRDDLEKKDCGIIIVDLQLTKKYRVIGLYRTFNPNDQTTEFNYFKNQMEIISESCSDTSIKNYIININIQT